MVHRIRHCSPIGDVYFVPSRKRAQGNRLECKSAGNHRSRDVTLADAMRTFDASLPRSGFWSAVVVPPVFYLLIVQGWANGIEEGQIGIRSTLMLVGLAQLLPLGALAWTVLSTAAYSIAPGKLVIHRVMFDREFALANLAGPPRLEDGVITLHLPHRLRLRVAEPQTFLDLFEAAVAEAARTSTTPA